jgi:hypothetical protein
MWIRIIIFLFISFPVQRAFAQNSERLNALREMPDSVAIEEGRKALIKALKDSNYEVVRDYRNALLKREDSVRLALFEQEKILLHFWLNELVPLTHLIHRPAVQSDFIVHWPPYDTLYATLVNRLGKARFNISYQIQKNPELSPEEKDFLLLALGYFIGEQFESQEKINEAADRFIATYPESEYNYLVENSFRQVYYPIKSKFSASLLIGNNSLEGDMSQLFRDNFAIGFTLGYYYQKIMFRLSTTWGFTSPRRDIILAERLWERGYSSSMTQFETSVGYVFLEHSRFSFIPFAGIGTTSFAPMTNSTEDEEYFRGVSFKAKFTNYAGLGIRYNIQKQQKADKYFVFEDQTYSYLKFEYRFANPFMDHGYDGMGGRTHLISLSYAWFVQPLRGGK